MLEKLITATLLLYRHDLDMDVEKLEKVFFCFFFAEKSNANGSNYWYTVGMVADQNQ